MTRFTIDRNWIADLDDEQSRELLARLCRAELVRSGKSPALVTWGGDQRAIDGGVDVKVDAIDVPPVNIAHLSVGGSIIQVKAEKFGPAKIEAEMKPKGVIRPFFTNLNNSQGTYLIASTRDDCSHPMLQSRISMMADVLKAEGLSDAKIDFLDIRRLADWVENHIGVQVWIRKVLGRPMRGWEPYGPWAHGETDIQAEFRMDDTPRVMPPGGKSSDDLLSLGATIEHIRNALAPQTSEANYLRLVGLSGVGKTRLVQALFDERVAAGVIPSKEKVIYTDAGLGSEPTPHEMITELGVRGESAIIIVDNCGSETHSQLVELAKTSNSKISLLTVEFDIQDDLPIGTKCYQMEAASVDLLASLLRDRYPQISQIDSDRIASLSDGNARIAIAVADQIKETDNVGELRDTQLFDRLFSQRNLDDSEELRRTAEAASLVYSFDISADSNECERLAGYAELSRRSFLRNIATLERRGLIQRRGDFRALLPHALANRIARDTLASLPPQELYDDFFGAGIDRFSKSFAHRLSFLHTCSEAVDVSNIAFNANGICSDIRVIKGEVSRLFQYLASTNPDAALDVIENAVKNGEVISEGISRLLFNLAYEEETFDRTAEILTRISPSNLGGNNSSDPHQLLTTMFQLHFSGTLAQTERKLIFIDRLLDSSDLNRSDIALECLCSGLKNGHFSSSNIFEFGGRSRSYGWMPRTWGKVADQFSVWMNRLVDIAIQQPNHSQQVREILANRFRGLWAFPLVRPHIVDAINRLLAAMPWPEGYHEAQETLRFDGDKSDVPNSTPLRDLIIALAPHDLITQIQSNVIVANNWSEIITEDGTPLPHDVSMAQRMETATNLGEQAGVDEEILESIREAVISKTNGGLTEEFGHGVGLTITSISDELEKAKVIISAAGGGYAGYNYPLGLIKAWQEQDSDAVLKWLEHNEGDPVWRVAIPWVLTIVGMDELQLSRLIDLLEQDDPPIHSFGYHTFRQLTESLSVSDQRRLYDALVGAGAEGANNALDQIKMRVHGSDPVEQAYKDEMLDFLIKFPWGGIGDGNDHMDYGIGVIFKRIVADCDEEDAFSLIKVLALQTDDQNRYYYNDPRKKALREMFRHFPFASMARFCVADANGSYKSAYELCGTVSKYREGFIEVVPDDILLSWADVSDDKDKQARVEFLARTCRLLDRDTGGMKEAVGFRDLASDLARMAVDPSIVLGVFADRAVGSSFTGSIANHIRVRRSFFDKLNLDDRAETNQGLEQALAYLNRKIDREQAREDAEAKASAERFE